jgi:hypothetical protein
MVPRSALLLALAVACGGGQAEVEPTGPEPPAAAPAPPMPETAEWHAHRIDDAGITLDLLEDPPLSGGPIAGGGAYLGQRLEPMRLYVAWGRDVEADHRATTGRVAGAEQKVSDVTVCGRPTRLVHTRIPGVLEPGRGPADGNPVRVGEEPPRDRIELLFETGGVPVRIMYEVDSRYRELHLGDEERFLGSIRCP